MRSGQRLFFGGLGLATVVGGLAAAGAILLRASKADAALALIPIVFVGIGACLLVAIKAGRIALYEDAIELVELGRGKRRARRDEIAGMRIVPLQYGYQQYVFELRGGKKPLKLTWVHEIDPVLQSWLDAIPNLDAEDRAGAEAELLRSEALGADEDERVRTLNRARRVAYVLNGISVATCVWGWLYPRPYLVAIVALGVIPLVGIATFLGGRGRYSFDGNRNDPRPSLGVTVMCPGLVLALRAILDVQVLDWTRLLVGAAVGGLTLVVAIAVGERTRKFWVLALIAPIISGYPWGALCLANALLDRGLPEVFEVAVRGKHVSGGKQTSWELELDPWGPVLEPKDASVSEPLYDAVSVGDRVCVALYPGALGARWYDVGRCGEGKR
jgi:hypothetical protein